MKCHICKKEIVGECYEYLVNYPLGLYKLQFCCEEHRDEYIKKHIAEYYHGVPIYQQFNYCNGETAYMLNYYDKAYTFNIQDVRNYIDDIFEENKR